MDSILKPALIDETLIHNVVHLFYKRVRQDPVLGPIFDGKIGDHWDLHLARMVDFWSSVLLTTGRYSGRPHVLHQALDLEASHFARWLGLFKTTVQDLCAGEAETLFLGRARQIAASLQAGCGIFPYADYNTQGSGQ